jgi:hypothetical protein
MPVVARKTPGCETPVPGVSDSHHTGTLFTAAAPTVTSTCSGESSPVSGAVWGNPACLAMTIGVRWAWPAWAIDRTVLRLARLKVPAASKAGREAKWVTDARTGV